MQKQNLTIKYLSVEDLIPYARNSRTHSPEQVAQIASSIKEFGFTNPILVDAENGIIAGHGRLQGAQKLGLKEVPTIEVTGWTDAQKRAYIIADNKLALNAGWDEEILRLEFEELKDGAFDLELTGFDTAEIDDILDVDISLDDVEEDEAPEPPVVPKSQLGDVWTLGNHCVMCGDSTDAQQVATLMGGEKADLLFTDPPYGYNYQSNMRSTTQKFDVLKNDDKFLDFFPAIKSFAVGFVFVCTTWKVVSEWIDIFQKHYKLTNMIIWNKGGGGIGDLEHTFSTDYEIILCSNNKAKITGKRIGSVWSVKKDNPNDYVHATQKPVGLSALAIQNTTKRGGVVLDVFGGSGSTLIACEQFGRKARLMELDPKYCDVIINRWQELTGLEAVRQDGVKFNDIVIGE